MNRRPETCLTVCILGLGLLACGGEDDGRPSGEAVTVPALDQCVVAEGYERQNIVNFERRTTGFDPTLALCDPATPCTFYFNADVSHAIPPPGQPPPDGNTCAIPFGTEPSTSSPPPMQATLNGSEFPGERCNAPGSGMHITATNLGNCMGTDGRLGWGASLDLTFAPVLNASDWEGVSFWVKKGAPASRESIIFSIVDPYTSGAALPDGTPTCYSGDPDPTRLDITKCDAFSTAVTLRDEWSFVAVPFAAMRQKGFGAVSALGRVDQSQISRMQFLLMASELWDIWIDDVALFRRRE